LLLYSQGEGFISPLVSWLSISRTTWRQEAEVEEEFKQESSLVIQARISFPGNTMLMDTTAYFVQNDLLVSSACSTNY